MFILRNFVIIISLFLVVGCASKNKDAIGDNFTDKQLFSAGQGEFNKHSYKKAAEFFKKLSQEYPYSDLASKAQFMEGMSYFRATKYDDAATAFDEYIHLYPASENIAYIYYMKALSYYDQISPVRFEQTFTVKAEHSLQELVNRFPESKYAKDAKLKLDLIINQLAGKEMYIGRYYLKTGQILAALPRFQIVVQRYQKTIHIEEALYRLVYGFHSLSLNREAKKYASILGTNYPNSKWYKYSYELIKNVN